MVQRKYDRPALKLEYICSEHFNVTDFFRNKGIDIKKAWSGSVLWWRDEKQKLTDNIYKTAIKTISESKVAEIDKRVSQVEQTRKINIKWITDDILENTTHQKDGVVIKAKWKMHYQARKAYNEVLRLEVWLPSAITKNENDNTNKFEWVDIRILWFTNNRDEGWIWNDKEANGGLSKID